MRARNQMRALQMMLRLVPLDEYDLRATVCINSLVLFPVFIYEFYYKVLYGNSCAFLAREKRMHAYRARRPLAPPRAPAPGPMGVAHTSYKKAHRASPNPSQPTCKCSGKCQDPSRKRPSPQEARRARQHKKAQKELMS